MAQQRGNDLLSRLAGLSEDALQRIADAPGADRLLGAVNTLRDRTDELQKRVRGLEQLERRLAAVERKVDKLSKGSTTTRRAAKTTSTKSSGGSTTRRSTKQS